MLRPVYVRHWRIPHYRVPARRCPGRIARPGHGSVHGQRVKERRVSGVPERRHRRLQRLSAGVAWLRLHSLADPELESDRMITRIRRLFRHQPGARAEEQRGYHRPRLENTGSSRPLSRLEGDVHRALAFSFGQKISVARLRYLVLQCDICSEHGGRCLPWGNPQLLAKDFGGSRSREPVASCVMERAPRPWFRSLAALLAPRLGRFSVLSWQSCIGSSFSSSRAAASPARTGQPASPGKQKPRTSGRPGARRSRSVKVSRRYGKPPGTER